MKRSRNYWIATHTTGYPSSRPLWGVWEGRRLCFSSGSQIGKSLEVDPRVQVNLESGDELVIIEGKAAQLAESDLQLWVEAYNRKYHWDMPESTKDVYEVTPQRVLAWLCDSGGEVAEDQYVIHISTAGASSD